MEKWILKIRNSLNKHFFLRFQKAHCVAKYCLSKTDRQYLQKKLLTAFLRSVFFDKTKKQNIQSRFNCDVILTPSEVKSLPAGKIVFF